MLPPSVLQITSSASEPFGIAKAPCAIEDVPLDDGEKMLRWKWPPGEPTNSGRDSGARCE